MNRQTVVHAFQQVAMAHGYEFYFDDEKQIPTLVSKYPAVWLAPLQFLKIEGRKHGKITYSVKVYAMFNDLKLWEPRRISKMQKLEEDLVQIFAEVSQYDGVVVVNDLKIKNESKGPTRHGELVMVATAEVVTFF